MSTRAVASEPQAKAAAAGQKLLPVEEARARILAAMLLLDCERIPVSAAHGRVTGEDVAARLSHPPSAVSAMDGYALRSADAEKLPVRLRKAGVSRAGARFAGQVEPGACVQIFTGAAVPDGADLIAVQEEASEEDGIVEIRKVPSPGRHIRAAGLDFKAGQVCVPAGRALSARDVGLIASCGHAQIPVRRRPRIAILSTGDELVEPGVEPGPDQIPASNSIALAAAVASWGGEPLDLGIARDETNAIAQAADLARGADLLVTTGGASVGEHDLVQAAMRTRGLVVDFWRIAMRPGKPLMFGRIGELPVLAMPGNPVSALVCAILFLRPAMNRMLGLADAGPHFEPARLGVPMKANDSREDYIRTRLERAADGSLVAHPFTTQDSSMLMTLSEAGGLLRRASFAPPAEAGENVDVIRFDLAAGRL
ncbi:MAG: molybdopterin molybdotransferase MoeA [Bradyrhizobiaceae bacterium]|nr:molybdopterin molybdotransferase MoeA [Bradyrhizobiaceae bacterium]